MITEMNNKMAIRIVSQRSQFDHEEVKNQIIQYKKLKKTLHNNKKILTPFIRGT
jgi:hypothetical protein